MSLFKCLDTISWVTGHELVFKGSFLDKQMN